MLLNYLVYVTLPVPLKYTGILLGLGAFATYVNTIIGLAKKENYFWDQVSGYYSNVYKTIKILDFILFLYAHRVRIRKYI